MAITKQAGKTVARKWYQMEMTTESSADIYVFGDVTPYPWLDSDVSAHGFVQDLESLGKLESITVHINSYGGDVSEGVAIYNALLANPAKVTTVNEAVACSIASVIFMAGEKRIMRDASLLFLHNCWGFASGNSSELQKASEDMATINELSKKAYARSGADYDYISKLMDEETWLDPQAAVEGGFATEIDVSDASGEPVQSALKSIISILGTTQSVDIKRFKTKQVVEDDDFSALEARVSELESRVDALETDEEEPDDQEIPGREDESLKGKLANILG